MKKLFLLVLVLLGAFIFKIPEYVELNNLAIIEAIGIDFTNDKYTVYLKEVIPKKDENGIKYEYKYYKSSDLNLEDVYKKLSDKTKKKLYYNDAKFLITNLEKSNKIVKLFSIKPKNIIHTKKDIYKELKTNV